MSKGTLGHKNHTRAKWKWQEGKAGARARGQRVMQNVRPRVMLCRISLGSLFHACQYDNKVIIRWCDPVACPLPMTCHD